MRVSEHHKDFYVVLIGAYLDYQGIVRLLLAPEIPIINRLGGQIRKRPEAVWIRLSTGVEPNGLTRCKPKNDTGLNNLPIGASRLLKLRV